MKLEKVTLKNKGWILEEMEDANKPTKVEPEKVEPVLNDEQKALAKREEEIKKIIAKRLEATKKVAEETKGKDYAILSKDIKVEETLCKDRKEVGTLIESLKEKGIKFFVKKINEGENRYKVIHKPITEKVLKENDCDNIDIEALEWYVNNYSEGDNITVTADLLNVLEQSLEMYKKHCDKEVKEEWEDDEASIQRAKDYWANEVYFQLENIEDLSQDERILNASEEQIKEMANDIAQEIIDDEHLWGEINETIEWYIYHHDYMLANRKDESLNENEIKEAIISKEQLKKIVDRYDLEDIMKGDLDSQDTDINEIILDCMDEVNKDDIEAFTKEWDELYAKIEPLVYQEIRSRGYKTESTSCSKKGARKLKEDNKLNESSGWIAIWNGKKCEIKKDEAKDLWGAKQLAIKKLGVPKSKVGELAIDVAFEDDEDGVSNAQFEAKNPINKKISNPRKAIKEEREHRGPFQIEYWVDEEARDMGLGDMYLETFEELEEAKAVADDLFGEVASVEVLDANGQVVYGRYPEDEGCSKKTIKEETMEVEDEDGDEFEIEVFETYEEAWDYLDNLGKEWIKDGVCNDYSIADDSYVIDNGLLLIAYDKDNPEDEDEDGEETGDQCLVAYKKGLEDESLKEDEEVVYVVTELGNDMGTFDSDSEAIKFAKEHNHQQVEKRFKDDLEGDYEVVWSNEKFESLKEDLETQKQAAFENACDCLKYGYGKDKWNSAGLSKEDADEVWKKAVDEMSKDEGKKEKKFAKKVMKPGVQMDDDDMNASVAFNEEEAHALIGDKPIIIEEGKSEIEMANDFSSTFVGGDALKSLEDDDNI